MNEEESFIFSKDLQNVLWVDENAIHPWPQLQNNKEVVVFQLSLLQVIVLGSGSTLLVILFLCQLVIYVRFSLKKRTKENRGYNLEAQVKRYRKHSEGTSNSSARHRIDSSESETVGNRFPDQIHRVYSNASTGVLDESIKTVFMVDPKGKNKNIFIFIDTT